MPIESQINGRIATLLDRMNSRWTALAENKGVFQGSQRQPDILVIQQDGRPVVIENEYVPAAQVEAEALARLGEQLESSVATTSRRIDAVIAMKSPIDLRNCGGLDEVDSLLTGGIALEYALFRGQPPTTTRFPERGFVRGSLRDLAAFVVHAAIPEEAVEEAVSVLEDCITTAGTILRQAVETSDDTKYEIVKHLKQEYGDQALRMAAAIMINALVFHENIAGQHGVKSLDQLQSDGILTRSSVLDEWRKILNVNYWSIFHVAGELLRNINPPRIAIDLLKLLISSANRLASLGVFQSHDLSGTVFQRLIADRKFLATFYTRPESAALLARLAIPDDGRWHDPEQTKSFRVADYACGTGTLIHAAYRRINLLHRLAGGTPERLHAHMMENSLTACDVLPSAVHLTASMLSSSHPRETYDGSRTIVTEYGRTDSGGVSLGSLDLLNGRTVIRPLIPMHTATVVHGVGEGRVSLDVDMPHASQDLVIMNPPFTRPGSDWEGEDRQSDYIKQFRGLSVDLETQREMSALARKYAADTCAHGYAGLASWFVALADRMVKQGGTIALVLPLTALHGASWKKVRQLIAQEYSDVTVLTIAAPRAEDQSFSADTGIAETLIVCRKSSGGDPNPENRGLFVSLKRRPRDEMEATELARAISALAEDPAIRPLEVGPFGGRALVVGEERLGEVIDAPLSEDAPWSVAAAADLEVGQTAYQLARGRLWTSQMREQEAQTIPMSTVEQTGQVGINHSNIVGPGEQAAFELHRPATNASSYPMLWSHNAKRETHLVVSPDSYGRIKAGKEDRAFDIWGTRSHAHHNADFRFNSQPLAMAFTEQRTIGGTAWKNVRFAERTLEIAYTLWGNTTLGLLCYWWHSSRQQSGRGRMPISSIRTMPTLDVTALSPEQLAAAESIFEDMRTRHFLPANQAYEDPARKELDYRVLIEMLGMPESVLAPLDLLRLKWCSEPSVHGGKRTAPPEDLD